MILILFYFTYSIYCLYCLLQLFLCLNSLSDNNEIPYPNLLGVLWFVGSFVWLPAFEVYGRFAIVVTYKKAVSFTMAFRKFDASEVNSTIGFHGLELIIWCMAHLSCGAKLNDVSEGNSTTPFHGGELIIWCMAHLSCGAKLNVRMG